ncbi:AlpA family transcriptional regulator [Buttiauxella sp. S04-F03]|uniref:helix-turn-helix transcriptional regulator n=1 Tax=Buttiauxella sp. S04-F03 TaxID=2904525 RepID=UPI0012AE27BB|nr:AlpA family phage regulatory protein [Buttiauxella sp. S04-F03]MCE0815008.1 AlpA family phage regulatory protein [Buttiauxella sp. S04-F03]MRT15157.1 AlpA family phage regulatory protein [Enterobacteriaceae bacterium RIT711]
MTPEFISLDQAAAHFGISRSSIYNARRWHRPLFPRPVSLSIDRKHEYRFAELSEFLQNVAGDLLAKANAKREAAK